MGNYYGYNRVSSKTQNEDRGNTSIENFCSANRYHLEKIYIDKHTGKDYDRSRYKVLKEDVLRPGDTLIVSEFDRLGRAKETKEELEYFKNNHIRVIFLDIPTTQMDLSNMKDEMAKLILTCINEMLISFYDCLARAELERRTKRQREGYEEMKKRGEWHKFGRPKVMSSEEFNKAYSENVVTGKLKTSELRVKLNLTNSTYYKYVREYRKNIRLEKDGIYV